MKLAPFDLATAPLDAGTVLLEASAGTGKTYTLVGLLLRALVEGCIERLDQALVVTFTVAATEELKIRLRDALHEALRGGRGGDPFLAALARRPGARARLQAALDDFDQVSIATIHGFCKRVLEETAFESHAPFALEFTADPLPALYRAAADALRSQYDPAITARSALMHDLAIVPSKLVEHYRLWQRHPDGVRLDPEDPDPDGRIAALSAAIAKAAAAWNDSLQEVIGRLRWIKGKQPFIGDAATAATLLAKRLRSEPCLAFGMLCALAPLRATPKLRKDEARHLAHPFFAACAEIASAADDAHAHLRASLLRRMHELLQAHKRDEHLSTFDDLMVRTQQALDDPIRRPILLAALRARYRIALIDEFQDTDSLQYRIFATCFANRPLFLIGDPKQSIYGFRGADLRSYLRASRDAVQRGTLAVNWRSNDALVRGVSSLFAGAHAFATDGVVAPEVSAAPRNAGRTITADPGAPLQWRFVRGDGADGFVSRADAEDRIVADVAAEISRLLRGAARIDGRPVRPSDCAVLTRTNRQATAVQEALRDAGIPSAIGKAGDIFATEELAELLLFVRAVLAPADLQRVRAAMATRLWGADCATLTATDAEERAIDVEVERLDRWRRTWLRRGFVAMTEQMLVDLAVHKRLLAQTGGERRLTNLRQLIELLHDAEHQYRLSPEGLVEWLQRERAHQEDIDYTLRELRLESDGDAVQILTVHGSKGLQYEIVFCPFLWDGGKPRDDEVVPAGERHELALDLRKDDPAWHVAQAERLAEDLRLCYVAMTRARRRCYVHWGAMGNKQHGGFWRSALGWLLANKRPAPGHDADERPAPNWVELFHGTVKARIASLEQDLDERCRQSEGAMDLVVVADAPAPVPLPPAQRRSLPPARRPLKKPRARALFSYSSLIAGAVAAETQPDLADGAAQVPAVPATAAAPSAARGIFAFARGPAAGQCLHHVLEHVDLARLDGEDAAALVRSSLDSFGLLAPDAHAGDVDPVADVLRNLRDLAAARVHAGGPTAGELCRGARAVEWEFTLPAGGGSLQQLADVLHASSSAAARAQAERLRRLPDSVLDGFLVGFVDLLAEHDGRHWVVDWKSNHLGDAVADYGPDALLRTMCEHDYVLQYHLYVLALHRQLRARVRDYDYERHVGGVCYAFLRGAVPDATSGMFHDRVPRDVVLAMDRWLSGGGAR